MPKKSSDDMKEHIVHAVKPDADEAESEADSADDLSVVYPENIFKRLNALKNIHMETQNLEREFHIKMFLAEAELHKKMEPLVRKRAEIVTGTYEPNETEGSFKLGENDPQPETIPADGSIGIPKFWQTVLQNNLQAMEYIQQHDQEALAFLMDIRVTHTEKPLGFKLEFEFAENDFFTNKVLARSYEYDESCPDRVDLYLTSALSPKTTSGTVINWKEGKDLTKKVTTSVQRNKKTGERRQTSKMEKQESFFDFFAPENTDLHALMKHLDHEESGDHHEGKEHQSCLDKVQKAEMEYDFAMTLRTHVIPRAVLIYTQEDEEDDDDYDETDDDEDGHLEEASDDDDDDDEDASDGDKTPVKIEKKSGSAVGNGRPGGINKPGKGAKH